MLEMKINLFFFFYFRLFIRNGDINSMRIFGVSRIRLTNRARDEVIN